MSQPEEVQAQGQDKGSPKDAAAVSNNDEALQATARAGQENARILPTKADVGSALIVQNPSYEVVLIDLQRRIEISKYAYFAASERLRRRHRMGTYLTSLLSLCVIAISLVPFILPKDNGQSAMGIPLIPSLQAENLIFAGTTITSILILLISLFDSAQNYFHHSESSLFCGRQLSRLLDKVKRLRAGKPADNSMVESLSDEFQTILEKSTTTPDRIDIYYLWATKPTLFAEWHGIKPWLVPICRMLLTFYVKFHELKWLVLYLFAGYVFYLISIASQLDRLFRVVLTE